ncbi:MAG: hypothetical protein QOF60_3226 [Actinomycetota bacterium]|nr:hypothetical protein [Actinomycetota bacterium]
MSTPEAADRQVAAQIEDPFLRRSVTTALHLRRYLPFYVFGAVWVITIALFPSIAPGSRDHGSTQASVGQNLDSSGTGAASTEAATTDAAGASTDAAAATNVTGPGKVAAKSTAGTNPRAAGTSAASAGGTSALPPEQAAAAIQRGTGKTRLGTDCTPTTPQVPNSSYALPCQNVYTGPNGGNTYRGVTDKEILIVRRKFPDSPNQQAVDAVVKQAGGADPAVTDQVRAEFVKYFNKAFEMYGRQVNMVTYVSENGNSTDEALSKGKEGACVDADKIVLEMKAFGLTSAPATTSSPMSECSAERKMIVFDAAAYYPETFYRKYHPYLWGGPMECERISYQLAEYLGERLINKPAQWAGDSLLKTKNRYFGTYIPDNDGYQSCNNITRKIMKEKYGVEDPGPQYNYQLDVSRFPDQAAAATVQFSSKGVTTVILACDAISAIVLTEAATKQNWHPEWMTIGTGLTDIDNAARLYDQVQVDGHLFGPSQLGSADKLIGATSEPGIIYKQATGRTIPEGTSGDYFTLVRIFDFIQAAGPNLTPDNIAAATRTLPPGGAPRFAAGYTSYADGPDGKVGAGDHTAVDDSREVFWVNDPTTANKSSDKSSCGKSSDPYYNSADTCAGTYKETYGGRRFRNGEWPHETPPIYPPHTKSS